MGEGVGRLGQRLQKDARERWQPWMTTSGVWMRVGCSVQPVQIFRSELVTRHNNVTMTLELDAQPSVVGHSLSATLDTVMVLPQRFPPVAS